MKFLASAVRFMALWWQAGTLSQALSLILPASLAFRAGFIFLGEFNAFCRLTALTGALWQVHYQVLALP